MNLNPDCKYKTTMMTMTP